LSIPGYSPAFRSAPCDPSMRTLACRKHVRSSSPSYQTYAEMAVLPNDFLQDEALLIFRQLCRILVFEKLVAFFASISNEHLAMLRGIMKIGYARVSPGDQHLALQLDALRQAGCRQIYEEVVSGARTERPVLQQTLAHLRQGDVLMIWKLDRLGRSLRHLI